MEQWKTIEGHPNYEVSNLGNVRNIKKGTLLKPIEVVTERNKNGEPMYYQYNVNLNGKSKTISRLVAEAFIENTGINPDGTTYDVSKATVDHINRNSSDNRAENLQWVGIKYNVQKDLSKKVRDIDNNKIYPSARDAAAALKLDLGNLCSVCRGRYKYVTDGNGNKRHFQYV